MLAYPQLLTLSFSVLRSPHMNGAQKNVKDDVLNNFEVEQQEIVIINNLSVLFGHIYKAKYLFFATAAKFRSISFPWQKMVQHM
jgi:hypothetical protein